MYRAMSEQWSAIRSSSLSTRKVPIRLRQSEATGDWSTWTVRSFRMIPRICSSNLSSPSRTIRALSRSWLNRAVLVSSRVFSRLVISTRTSSWISARVFT